jgi:alpha-L-arabinofuranosidase
MVAVNVGTRAGDAARNLVEYCNHPGGTYYSDLRRQHGYEQPHGIKFWCLGNEMDGPWQMEYKTATQYGLVAKEAAKLMRWIDPTIELTACGSSARNMPSYGRWEDEVLEHTFEHVDYISLHTYLNNYADDVTAFLASPDLMDSFIDEVVAIADAVAARRRSPKRMMLCFDEWNVWYRTRRNRRNRVKEGWPIAPSILEEKYNLVDALAFGGLCISLLNHADRVRAACLAQLVNAIAPIMTETGGPAWRQTIFYPFAQMSRYGRGKVLRTQVEGESYSANYYDPRGDLELTFPIPKVPYLKVSAVTDDLGGLSLFLLNRHLQDAMEVNIEARSFGELAVTEALELSDSDLNAVNNKEDPDRIRPAKLEDVWVEGGQIRATLQPASWNVISLGVNRLSPN